MIRWSSRPARVRRYGPFPARSDTSFHHACLLQPTQSPGEKRARDVGQAPLELVEVTDIGQEFADYEHRPAIGKDFRCARDRTVLAIEVHDPA